MPDLVHTYGSAQLSVTELVYFCAANQSLCGIKCHSTQVTVDKHASDSLQVQQEVYTNHCTQVYQPLHTSIPITVHNHTSYWTQVYQSLHLHIPVITQLDKLLYTSVPVCTQAYQSQYITTQVTVHKCMSHHSTQPYQSQCITTHVTVHNHTSHSANGTCYPSACQSQYIPAQELVYASVSVTIHSIPVTVHNHTSYCTQVYQSPHICIQVTVQIHIAQK